MIEKVLLLLSFKAALPNSNSDIVEQALKDPYVFDFLNLTEQAQEKDIENALVDNIAQFLLELGKGFAFVGRQYHIIVGKKKFISTFCSIISTLNVML